MNELGISFFFHTLFSYYIFFLKQKYPLHVIANTNTLRSIQEINLSQQMFFHTYDLLEGPGIYHLCHTILTSLYYILYHVTTPLFFLKSFLPTEYIPN